ncbi:hypothetical protein QUA54_25320 [Microcoleus sp. MOSTC5]
MRPFLTVWEETQMGQVGMGGEQPETLLLHHYILSTTQDLEILDYPQA